MNDEEKEGVINQGKSPEILCLVCALIQTCHNISAHSIIYLWRLIWFHFWPNDQIHVYSILCNDLVIIVFNSLNIDFISYNGLYYPNPYIYIYKGLCPSACPSFTLLWTNPGTNIYHKCVGSGNISQSQVGVGKQFLHTCVCGCIYDCPIYRHFLSCSSQLKSH